MQTFSMADSTVAVPVQPYFIPRHVHFCETGNQVVFLDLRRDKYLAIGQAERQALSGLVVGWPSDAPPAISAANNAVVQSMLKLGLLTQDARIGKEAAPLTIDLVDAVFVDDDFERRTTMHARLLSSFLFACARAKLALAMRPFGRVVAAVRKRKAKSLQRAGAFDLDRGRELVAVFDRLRPFIFTAKDACLFDSLAMIEFLALHELYPDWLLGVQVQPFGAHSWVQHRHFVFNGSVEYVRRFTPILAV